MYKHINKQRFEIMGNEIMNPKVRATGLGDVLAMGIVKKFSEAVLTPYIGNGTLKSGITKVFVGGIVHTLLNKSSNIAANIVGGALVIDGVEDGVTGVMGTSGGANTAAW